MTQHVDSRIKWDFFKHLLGCDEHKPSMSTLNIFTLHSNKEEVPQKTTMFSVRSAAAHSELHLNESLAHCKIKLQLTSVLFMQPYPVCTHSTSLCR